MRIVGRVVIAVGAVVLLAPLSALAQERFDHRGSVGVLVGGGLEYKEGVTLDKVHDGGLRYPAEIGGTYAFNYDGDELLAMVRASFGTSIDTAVIAGYRGYFGKDRAKTFFDVDLAVHFTPAFDIGPRVGFGFQYELAPVVGVYAAAAAQIGGGNGFRFSAEATVGLQFRSYLLE